MMAIENIETLDPTLDTPEVMAPEMSEEILAADPVAEELVGEEPVGEEVEVAGYRSKIANMLKRPIRTEGEDLTQPPKFYEGDVQKPLVEVDKDGIKIGRFSQDDMNEFQSFASKKGKDFDVIMPNMEAVGFINQDGKIIGNEEEAFDLILKEVEKAFEAYKKQISAEGKKFINKGEIGFKEILAEADQFSSPEIVMSLLERRPGDRPFTAAELTAARRLQIATGLDVKSKFKNFMQTNSTLDLAKLAQAISMQGLVTIRVRGAQEDIGRTLVAMKLVAAPSKEFTDSITQMVDKQEILEKMARSPAAVITPENIDGFLKAYGGEEQMLKLVAEHMRLPSEKRPDNAARQLLKNTMDMGVELYQSALLSNPLTHAYNTAGNIIMMETQMIERLLEGKARESFAMLTAQAKYMPQAFRGMWYALKHERSISDDVTKLDDSIKAITRKAFNLNLTEEGGGAVENAFAKFMDYSGVAMRGFGYRPMIAMDEFSKTLARGMQVEALAVRAQNDAYRASIKAGKSKKDAKADGINMYMKTVHSDTTWDAGSEFARMVTFQDDLPGILGDVMPIISHPIMKIWIPFYKTPTQVIRRILERSPFAVAMPTVMRDKIMKGSAEERKEAIARITFGTSMAATAMYLGKGGVSNDFVITGYGPSDKTRKRWLENHQPYAIGLRKEDGSFDWISYERYDPISGVLAMWMDGADLLEQSIDEGIDADAMLNAGLVMTSYPTQSLPMLQFLGEITDMAGSPYMSFDDKKTRIVEIVSKQVIKAGLVMKEHVQSGGVYPDSLQATFERYIDPQARLTIPENQYNGPIGDAYYQALHEMRARTPGLSTTLPTRKNRWYEEVYQTGHTMVDGKARGNIWQTVLPYRVVNKPEKSFINLNLELINQALAPLKRNMGEPKIKLTGTQYDRYIELYNFPYRSDFFEGEMPSATEAIEEVLMNKKFPDATMGQKILKLQQIDGHYKGIAKRLMKQEFMELQALIAKRDAIYEATGRTPKRLNKLNENEINEFLDSIE